jgi:hypothetical protein
MYSGTITLRTLVVKRKLLVLHFVQKLSSAASLNFAPNGCRMQRGYQLQSADNTNQRAMNDCEYAHSLVTVVVPYLKLWIAPKTLVCRNDVTLHIGKGC